MVGFSEILVALDVGQRDRATGAYLVKAGTEYLVAWRTEQSADYRIFRFEMLEEARAYLKNLKLIPGGRLIRAANRPERLWMRSSKEGEIIFWKLRRIPFTHQLTFQSVSEARYFFTAFERGFYSPSPFGHAILFSRTSF